MVDYTNAAGYVVDSKGRRQFQDRDKANGIDGTSLIADDRNQDRNALVDLVKAAGIVPDGADETQVTQAVQYLGKQAASSAVMGTPGVLADGDVAGAFLYYAASQKAPVFVYATTTVALVTTTALGTVLQGFLPLVGGNVTGPMDWGSKQAASTVTHRFWSSGPPAAGDAAPDATLTIAGGTPGTANKGTMALSTGVFDLSGSGAVQVPSIITFLGKDALNAETAEGRYVVSAPAAGQQRIVSLVGNADGRAMFGDGVNNPVLANLADLPFSDANIKEQVFTATVSFVDGRGSFTFPRAFRAGTIPYVDFANVAETGGRQLWAVVGIDIAETNGVWSPMVTNTTVHVFGLGWGGGTFANLQTTNQLSVSAKGYF